MTDDKLRELAIATLNMVEDLANEIELKHVSTDQELSILAQMAPVLLREMIDRENGTIS